MKQRKQSKGGIALAILFSIAFLFGAGYLQVKDDINKAQEEFKSQRLC